MTTLRQYTVILPKADRTGPCNLAIDLAKGLQGKGYYVRILYLDKAVDRDDLKSFPEVRTFKPRDLFKMKGVVHTHCLRPDILGALLRHLSPGCRVVTTLHNYFEIDLSFNYPRWLVGVAWWIWSKAIRRIDRRVCISDAMRRYYTRRLAGVPLDMVYNFCVDKGSYGIMPLENAEFLAWLETQRAAGRTVLAYVGSVSERKNILPLTRRVAESAELALVVCGAGPLLGCLNNEIVASGGTSNVIALGHVPNPHEIVARCDALILPSRAEGLPLAVIEAASAGKPALVSNIAVHRELQKLRIAVTIDHKSFSDLEYKATYAVKDLEVLQIKANWRRVFSPEQGVKGYSNLFNRLL